MAKLTDQSTIMKATETASGLRPGERLVVRNALPVAVESAKTTKGKRQRMATVASVDQQNGMVRMTDGSAVRVTPSTRMRMGTEGATVVLTEIRPGDELVVVIAEEKAGAAASPSALPRDVAAASPATLDADELMVFRELQAP